MSRFFRYNTKNTMNPTTEPGQETSDETQKKIIVKKDLEKIKWRNMKPKRGYRNGIYPKWSRLRGKVYKSTGSIFQNSITQSIDKIRVSVIADPVHPVQLTRSKSNSSLSLYVYNLKMPNMEKSTKYIFIFIFILILYIILYIDTEFYHYDHQMVTIIRYEQIYCIFMYFN